MALIKVNYVDNETVITAANMNAIQDEVIKNSEAIENGIAAPTLRATYDEETQTMKFENVPKEVEDQLYAPSGYVAEIIDIASETELDAALTDIVTNMPDLAERHVVFQDNAGLFNGGFTLARIFTRVGSYATATFETYGYYGYTEWVKNCYNGSWYPLEWENPPMVLGVEYRTTERWNGKAVYVKTIQNTPSEDVGSYTTYSEYPIAENTDLTQLVSVIAVGTASGGVNYVWPYLNDASDPGYSFVARVTKTQILLRLMRAKLSAGMPITITLKYIKD